MIKFFLLIPCISLCILNAQIVQQTGSVQFPYQPKGFSSKPNPEEVQQALKSAKLNALQRYVAGLDQNSRLNYQKIQSSVESNLDKVITNVSILRNDYDKKSKVINISLQAAINSSVITDWMRSTAPAAQLPKSDKNKICGAFVARRQADVEEFKTRRTDVSRDTISSEEFEEATSDGVSTSLISDQVIEKSRSTGGSSRRKSNKVEWEVYPSESLNATISGIVSTAGYRLYSAKSLGRKSRGLISTTRLKEDYSSGDDLSEETQWDLEEGCINLGITYLATGYLNVEAPIEDPISGQKTVYVNVNIQVWDLSDDLGAEVVASVGPIQFNETAETDTAAENKAIKLAAEKAGSLIVAGLQQANAR